MRRRIAESREIWSSLGIVGYGSSRVCLEERFTREFDVVSEQVVRGESDVAEGWWDVPDCTADRMRMFGSPNVLCCRRYVRISKRFYSLTLCHSVLP